MVTEDRNASLDSLRSSLGARRGLENSAASNGRPPSEESPSCCCFKLALSGSSPYSYNIHARQLKMKE